MDILKYKDYEGTAELDMTRGVCRGKILFINDVVTYESAQPASLQKEFEDAVDDYIATCTGLGRAPQKPLKGQFSVRVPSALHKAATLRAIAEEISLNELVVRALDAYVNVAIPVNHVENKTYYVTNADVVGGVLAHAGGPQAAYPFHGVRAATGVVTKQESPMAAVTGGTYVATSH